MTASRGTADWAGRVTLGTAQLAAGYGATRQAPGAPDAETVAELLATAAALGIRRLDTAPDYGGAEHLLGAVGLDGWEVDTKLPGLPDELADAPSSSIESWVRRRIETSLETLRIDHVTTLILHRPWILTAPAGKHVLGALRGLKEDGTVRAVGVSVYGPDEAGELIDAGAGEAIDVVQAPVSVVDRRMHEPLVTDQLRAAGVELHARSVYLQGLLLTPPERRPGRARAFDGPLAPWDIWVDGQQPGAALAASLGSVITHPQVARVVIGVEDARQLHHIDAAMRGKLANLHEDVPAEVTVHDTAVIDPRRWEQER